MLLSVAMGQMLSADDQYLWLSFPNEQIHRALQSLELSLLCFHPEPALLLHVYYSPENRRLPEDYREIPRPPRLQE